MEPGRLSIMAGRGALPVEVLEAARAKGWDVHYQSFVPRPDIKQIDIRSIAINKPLDIVLGIRGFKATHICMAGGVDVSDKGRQGFFKTLGIGRKKRAAPSGDTGLSRLGHALEIATGAKLIGAHEIVPGLLAESGLIAGPKPGRTLIADGRFAIETAIAAGQLDLGQAIVCSGRRVVAVEDIAGTDALLARTGAFVERGLVGDGDTVLVLAKAKKPSQPMFADLPAIGPDTIVSASSAGLKGIFVEAQRSIVIDRPRVAEKANELGICVYGVEANDS